MWLQGNEAFDVTYKRSSIFTLETQARIIHNPDVVVTTELHDNKCDSVTHWVKKQANYTQGGLFSSVSCLHFEVSCEGTLEVLLSWGNSEKFLKFAPNAVYRCCIGDAGSDGLVITKVIPKFRYNIAINLLNPSGNFTYDQV
jgi:hypothetical protein